jgi:hypothetical protein
MHRITGSGKVVSRSWMPRFFACAVSSIPRVCQSCMDVIHSSRTISENRVPDIIGRQNVDLIRKMEIRLPTKHRRNPETYPGVFLNFLKEKPPNLFELILKTSFWHSGNTVVGDRVKIRTGKEYRAMLNTSAWITCRHSLLKKAVWLVESGGVYFNNELDDNHPKDEAEVSAEKDTQNSVEMPGTSEHDGKENAGVDGTAQSVLADNVTQDFRDYRFGSYRHGS